MPHGRTERTFSSTCPQRGRCGSEHRQIFDTCGSALSLQDLVSLAGRELQSRSTDSVSRSTAACRRHQRGAEIASGPGGGRRQADSQGAESARCVPCDGSAQFGRHPVGPRRKPLKRLALPGKVRSQRRLGSGSARRASAQAVDADRVPARIGARRTPRVRNGLGARGSVGRPPEKPLGIFGLRANS